MQANPFIVDAIIGLSVVYKAFDNMDGFRRFFGFQPNTKAAVLVFGLFHGFGLATTLQELALSQEGLVTNMLSFNVGVEMGQILALMGVLIVLSFWRTRRTANWARPTSPASVTPSWHLRRASNPRYLRTPLSATGK